MRRSKSIETLLPILYLKGISTGELLRGAGGAARKDAAGLSASSIGRLKDGWFDEHDAWQRRDLSAKRYVYSWADAIHSKPGSKTKSRHPRVNRRDAGRGGPPRNWIGFTMVPRERARLGVICCSI